MSDKRWAHDANKKTEKQGAPERPGKKEAPDAARANDNSSMPGAPDSENEARHDRHVPWGQAKFWARRFRSVPSTNRVGLGRVGVDRVGDLTETNPVLHGQGQFGNQVIPRQPPGQF